MKNLIITGFVMLSLLFSAKAQDGKLISKTRYEFHDSVLTRLEKLYPDARTLASEIEIYSIVYLSDGLKVNGFLSVPKKKGNYPCIIYNRGGNRDFGRIQENSLMRFFAETSSWGYVVIGSQYRGTAGGEGREEFGGSDVNDVLNLIPCLTQVDKADTSRIGMYGWSRGGMMTYLSLCRTNKIKAAIVGSGITNAITLTKVRPEMDSVYAQLAPGYQLNRDSVLKARSVIFWPEKLSKSTPLLLLAGSSDWRVTPEEQVDLVSRLLALRHPVRFELYEGGQHSLMEHLAEVNHSTRNFMDTYLRDLKPFPNMELHGD